MKLGKTWILVGLALAGMAPTLAVADPPGLRRGSGGQGSPGWHARPPVEVRRFEPREPHVWRGGAWRQGWHGGRHGWWWVVGGLWYFYPQPIYPYPDPYAPPLVVIQEPAPAEVAGPAPQQYWYFCEASRSYYPYVPSCEGGWKPVPVTPPPGETK